MNTSATIDQSRKEQVNKILVDLIRNLEWNDTEAYIQMVRLLQELPAVRVHPTSHMDFYRWQQNPNHSLMVNCLLAVPVSYDHPALNKFNTLICHAKKIAAKDSKQVIEYDNGQLGDLDLISKAYELGCRENLVVKVEEKGTDYDSTIWNAAKQAGKWLLNQGHEINHQDEGKITADFFKG